MNSSIRNAVKILNCFSSETAELRLTDIAVQLNMNISTVHHLIKTLREEGVLKKNESNFYSLSHKIFEWGNMVKFPNRLLSLSNPYMHELVNRTGEVVHMGILDNDKVLYISKNESPGSMQIGTKAGSRHPVHCTALGKALLAQESEEVVQRLIEKGFEPKTQQTIVDNRLFMDEIKRVGKTGLASDKGEYAKEVYCIAVKLETVVEDYKVAISVCGPRFRMERNKEVYIRYLTDSALAISKAADEWNFKSIRKLREKVIR